MDGQEYRRRIRQEKEKLRDEEIFTSDKYIQMLKSVAREITDGRFDNIVISQEPKAGYMGLCNGERVTINIANGVTQSFSTKELKSDSIVGVLGHECGHYNYSNCNLFQKYQEGILKGIWYPHAPTAETSREKEYLEELKGYFQKKNEIALALVCEAASQIRNLLEDVYVEGRMCRKYPGSIRRGIIQNQRRNGEGIPSLCKQIAMQYEESSIMINLIVQYTLFGEINNWDGYQGKLLDVLEEVKPVVDQVAKDTGESSRFMAANQIILKIWGILRETLRQIEGEKEEENGREDSKSEEKEPEANEENKPEEQEANEQNSPQSQGASGQNGSESQGGNGQNRTESQEANDQNKQEEGSKQDESEEQEAGGQNGQEEPGGGKQNGSEGQEADGQNEQEKPGDSKQNGQEANDQNEQEKPEGSKQNGSEGQEANDQNGQNQQGESIEPDGGQGNGASTNGNSLDGVSAMQEMINRFLSQTPRFLQQNPQEGKNQGMATDEAWEGQWPEDSEETEGSNDPGAAGKREQPPNTESETGEETGQKDGTAMPVKTVDVDAKLYDLIAELAKEKAMAQMQQETWRDLLRQLEEMSFKAGHREVRKVLKRSPVILDSTREVYKLYGPQVKKVMRRLKAHVYPILKKQETRVEHKLWMGRRLDVRNVANPLGTVFEKKNQKGQEPSTALAVLVDMSESMTGQRMEYAKFAALCLYEFCRKTGIPITIYGHHTDGHSHRRLEAETVFLHSLAEYMPEADDPYRILQMQPTGSNRDGTALLFMGNKLLQRREKHKILVIISDGLPNATQYCGKAAQKDLMQIKRDLTKEGVTFLAAAIGTDREAIREIYQEAFLDISDMEKLPVLLAKQIIKYIRRW